MTDLVSVGEVLIDFTPIAPRSFYANPGGAPANVLAAAANLGVSTAFIGMVGHDDFGRMLEGDLQKAGIDTKGLRFTEDAPTTLAFVQLDERGDRSFTFVRKPGADMMLQTKDVDFSIIDNARAFHFGSVSLTDDPSRTTTLEAVAYAKDKGLLVSYDPNLRPLLWRSLDEAKEMMLKGFAYADIVKVSEEEMEFLTGHTDLEKGAAALCAMGPSLVLVTRGPAGCAYFTDTVFETSPTYDLKVVDTTGAGDAFIGSVLTYVLQSGKPLSELLHKEALGEMVDLASAVSALATTKPGGISSMPHWEDVENCRKNEPLLYL